MEVRANKKMPPSVVKPLTKWQVFQQRKVKLFTWVFMFLKVAIPMEGRVKPRLNLWNPLTYPVLGVFIIGGWLGNVITSTIIVVCEGFYNCIFVYINTIRSAADDQVLVELRAENALKNKQAKEDYEKYGIHHEEFKTGLKVSKK